MGAGVTPEMDSLKVLEPDSAETEDEKLLNKNNRADRAVSAFDHFNLPRNVFRGRRVSKGLRD